GSLCCAARTVVVESNAHGSRAGRWSADLADVRRQRPRITASPTRSAGARRSRSGPPDRLALTFDRYGITDGDPTWRHRRPVHTKACLAVATQGAQDRWISLSRPGVNVDHDAALISLVDTHAHVANPQHPADPCVLREGRVVDRLDYEIGTEPHGVEIVANGLTEIGDRSGTDERQRERIEDAALLFDDAHSRAEFGCQLRVDDVELTPRRCAHHRRRLIGA